MKILWTVNTLMPEIANEMGIKSAHAISWVDAMSKRLILREDISLAIACPGPVKEIVSKHLNNITYVVFPQNNKDYWTDILEMFKPDIIHAYGTEKSHNYSLVKNHKNYPIIVSLQGILSEYQHHYYAGIEYSEMLKRISIKSLLFRDGFFSGRWDFIRNSKLEQKILKESKCVEGRSTWDYVSSKNINPSLDYYYCPRMIRSPFFEYQWNSETMEPHTIFVHQGNYPIKGLHFVFIALKKLLDKYPDTKLYIAGSGYFYPKTLKEKLVQNPYIKYLKDLMNKLGIENNIIFTGFLSAEELASKLSKVNVVVIPSSIENAPNSLAESEIVGTPTIASFVGGNMDMLEHNKEGYLYCYNEPNMLAEYIERIFDSNELANSFSFNEKKTARGRHNPEKLEKTLLAIYEDVINKFN